MGNNDDILSLLFGKNRRRRRRSRSRSGFGKKRRGSRKGSRKRSGVKKVSRKRAGWCVKSNKKSGKRCVRVYKIKGKVGRYYHNGKKVPKGKACYKTKAKAEAARKKLVKKTKRKGSKKSSRRRSRRSSFGVGGSYVPLGSMMSPYPYSVNASPPWI